MYFILNMGIVHCYLSLPEGFFGLDQDDADMLELTPVHPKPEEILAQNYGIVSARSQLFEIKPAEKTAQ